MEGARPPTVLQPIEAYDGWDRDDIPSFNVDWATARIRFREFFSKFRTDNIFVYRDALTRQWHRKQFFIEVQLSHLEEYDEVLYKKLLVMRFEFFYLT